MRRLALACLLAALAACAPDATGDDGKVVVVASFYPVAFAAQQIGGTNVRVRNLTPAGVEPHDLELTSRDVDRIDAADVVLYIGSGFQPAVAAAAKRRAKGSVDIAAGVLASGTDPHFWLDPTLMGEAAAKVEAALAAADPTHRATYARNVARFRERLGALDADFRAALSHCARTEIVTAHAAFSYMARRYGLTQHGITGVSADAEPDPQRLAELSDLVTNHSITTVFYEELVPRKFADTLAREAGVKTAVLNPLEGLSQAQQKKGATYFSVMRRNLTALKTALGC